MFCGSQRNIGHRPVLSIHICLVLPPPFSPSCCWVLLSIFVFQVFFSHHLPLWLCYIDCMVCVVLVSGRHAVPLRLLDKTWLRTALFSPSSSAIRQTECSIIETMFLVTSRKRDLLDMLSRSLQWIPFCGFFIIFVHKVRKLFYSSVNIVDR